MRRLLHRVPTLPRRVPKGRNIPTQGGACGFASRLPLGWYVAPLRGNAQAPVKTHKLKRRHLKAGRSPCLVRFAEAIPILRSLAAATKASLTDLSQVASTQLALPEADVEQLASRSSEAFRAAKQLMGNREFSAAASLLEAIPPSGRDEVFQAVLAESVSCRDEVVKLISSIRRALQSGRSGDLAPKIDRLLAIVPDDRKVQRLAIEVRDSLMHEARKRLKNNEYAVALDVLQRTPLAELQPTRPVVGTDQVSLADAWWRRAKTDAAYRSAIRRRAKHWYSIAIENLPQGLQRIKVEMRLDEMARESLSIAPVVSWGREYGEE